MTETIHEEQIDAPDSPEGAAPNPAFVSAFITVRAAAEQLSVSLSTCYDLCYDGTLASVKVRGSRRVVRA